MKPTWILLLAALFPACSDGPQGPAPGPTPPGASCDGAADCGCWQCACQGIGGGPGAAQLCSGGRCPSGAAACAQDCATADAGVEKATAIDHCPARP